MFWGTALTERAREDEKLFGQRTSVAPHDVPSQASGGNVGTELLYVGISLPTELIAHSIKLNFA